MSLAFAPSTDVSSAAAQAMAIRTPWTAETGLPSMGPVLHFTQDREIYGEGDEADAIFKVVSGVVRTCKFLSDGRRLIDAFHVAGDIFGVEAGAEYSFSSEAVCDCTVISYRRRGLEASASQDAGLSQHLFSYAMRSLARAQVHALLLGRRSAVEKVAAFLVDWATHSANTGTVTLEMTRQDIADYLGLTIETVSRTLSQFERDALIAFSTARQIRLTHPAALRSLNS
jgi:CRP/FNR family transcriptional regulator, nitrogen fixation regulation protein